MNERLAFRTGLLRQLLVASAVASAACGDSGSGSGAGGSGGGGETASGGGGETASGGGGAAAGGQGGEGGQGAAGGGNAGGQGGMAGAGGSSGSGMNGVERCFFGVPPCPPAAEAVTVFGSCTDQLELVTEWISGPTEVNGTCCYQVNVTAPNAGECAAIGRPFMVENQARVAPLRVGDRRWEAAGLAPDLSSLSPELRAQLGREWAHDAAYEHASIASFGKLALELLVFGAPADLIERTHRAAADEIRHAQAGFALASSYLGQPVGPSTLPEAARLVLAGSLEELAAAAVREGCCGETLAALVADAQRDAATDPVVREVLTRIAAEEAEHAALAYSVVAWAIATGGDSVRTAAHRAFIESTHDLEQACANAEQSEALSHNEALRAHGRLSAKEALRERLRGMREVVAPAMAQLLGEAS